MKSFFRLALAAVVLLGGVSCTKKLPEQELYGTWNRQRTEVSIKLKAGAPEALKAGVPVVEGIFKDYFSNVLKSFTHLFVQNQLSKDLLSRIGITNTTIVGDTRFDRVLDIYKAAKLLPIVELFKQDKPTIVAGSSWSPDEELLVDYFNNHPEIKLIIAPHVVNEERLAEIESKLKRSYVLYTQAGEEKMKQADCLIIDGYGLLSSIYRYGEIAYVGGGFGAGIHNVLEAAVYGIPVVFGPNNRKFREARHLLEVEGGFEVQDTASFSRVMDRLLIDKDFLEKAGRAAGDYVRNHSGALHKILKKIEF